MRSVKRSGKLATATALLLWRKCLELRGEKPFIILNANVYALFSYSFSFDPSLWWPLLISAAALKVTCSFTHLFRLPASCNNVPQHTKMFPDSKTAA